MVGGLRSLLLSPVGPGSGPALVLKPSRKGRNLGCKESSGPIQVSGCTLESLRVTFNPLQSIFLLIW